jgi:hypothetical protein
MIKNNTKLVYLGGVIFCMVLIVISIGVFKEVVIFDILPTEKISGVIETSKLNAALEGDSYECSIRYKYNGNIRYTSQILGINENQKYLIGDSVELVVSKRYPEKVATNKGGIRLLICLGVITTFILVILFLFNKKRELVNSEAD